MLLCYEIDHLEHAFLLDAPFSGVSGRDQCLFAGGRENSQDWNCQSRAAQGIAFAATINLWRITLTSVLVEDQESYPAVSF
jgi:hypothetical protein